MALQDSCATFTTPRPTVGRPNRRIALGLSVSWCDKSGGTLLEAIIMEAKPLDTTAVIVEHNWTGYYHHWAGTYYDHR